MTKPGRVLIVAGSDSGGGAGIQADIKTVTALGGYAMTAITAVTVQNTLGVKGFHEVPLDVVHGQIAAVLEDIGADVVKTGMLASVAIIQTVAATLRIVGPDLPRVVDPVMRAKGGHALLPDAAAKALIEHLVQGATLITPNLPEAEVLTGRVIKTEMDMLTAVPALRKLGAANVLLKGGHLEGNRVVDLLITADGIERFEDSRIESAATHGTGCTLASAIAAGIADKLPLVEAITRARAYVRQAMLTAPGLGKGHGPLNHGHTVGPFTGGE